MSRTIEERRSRWKGHGRAIAIGGLAFLLSAAACDPEPDEPEPQGDWQVLTEGERGALLSIWGTSPDDVWVVGADARDDTGPLVYRVRDGALTRLETGEPDGDLWWVFGFENGPVFMGGSGGVILRYDDGAFTKLDTPGVETVFGLWGATPEDMWAVGGATDSGGGFAWRLTGDEWVTEPSLPAEVETEGALWKMYGKAADDAWIVGSNGLSFHWNGTGLTAGDTGVGSSLFTVVATPDRYVAVGGFGSGIIVEDDGAGWVTMDLDASVPGMTGVSLADDGRGVAVGAFGTVVERRDGAWDFSETAAPTFEDLHATWLDPAGGVWAAGGNTAFIPLTAGVLLYRAPTP